MGLDTVEVLQRIEKYFGLAVPNREAEKASTVQEIYEMVLRHLPADIDTESVYKVVVHIIADQAGIDEIEIEPQHSLITDLGLD